MAFISANASLFIFLEASRVISVIARRCLELGLKLSTCQAILVCLAVVGLGWELGCVDFSLSMLHPSRILQQYTTFGESSTHLLTFLKSPSNIGWGDAEIILQGVSFMVI